MNGGGGAGEVVDLVDFQQEGLDDVVSDQLKPRIPEVVYEVLLPAGEEVVDDDDAISPGHEAVDEVAADEAGAAGDDDAEALALEAEGDFADRVDAESGGEVAVLVHGSVGLGPGQLGGDVRVGDRGGGAATGAAAAAGGDGEEEGGDGNADEDEDEALLAEDVPNRTSHGEPRLRRLRRVVLAHRLRLVAAEYQLGGHLSLSLSSLTPLSDSDQDRAGREGRIESPTNRTAPQCVFCVCENGRGAESYRVFSSTRRRVWSVGLRSSGGFEV